MNDTLTARVVEKLNRPTKDAICLPNAAYTLDSFLDQERQPIVD